MRGDDYPTLWVSQGRLDGGHQIGKALAHARARLDHEMLLRGNGLLDRASHLQLLRPVFIVVQPPRDCPARTEDRSQRHGWYSARPQALRKVQRERKRHNFGRMHKKTWSMK